MVDYAKASGVTYTVSYVLNFPLSSTHPVRAMVLAYAGYRKAVATLDADSFHEQNVDALRSH